MPLPTLQQRRPSGFAQSPREGPSLRRAAQLRMADGAVDAAHGEAGATDRRPTGRL